jgi:hypothetical protein
MAQQAESEPLATHAPTPEPTPTSRLLALQGAAGNATVSRLLAPAGPDDALAGEPGSGTEPAAVIANGGSSLDPALRADMEGALGADLSTVRVHDGTQASASARALGAHAYTVGEDIVLGEGGPDRRTMAHELAHVVQQRAGAVDGTPTGAGFSVSSPDDRFERAAAATADTILGGGTAALAGGLASAVAGSASAQRQTDEDEDEKVQTLADERETPTAQRQTDEDEDEKVQMLVTAPVTHAGVAVVGQLSVQRDDDGSGDGGAVALAGGQGGGGKGSTTVGPPTTSTYDVSGTLVDAANTISARTEAGSETATPSLDTVTDGDRIVSATVTVGQAVQLPNWTDRGKGTPTQQAEWDRFAAAIKTHEDGHVSKDVSAWAGAHTKIAGKSTTDGNAAFDAISAAADQANNTYDANTQHGLTQGTGINPNV